MAIKYYKEFCKKRWEFWIDIGGTFTDVLAHSPEGELITLKLLSSGVTRGRVSTASKGNVIRDSLRTGEPDQFWSGYILQIFDPHTCDYVKYKVLNSSRGIIEINGYLQAEIDSVYELSSGEEAPVFVLRHVLGLGLNDPIPPVNIRLGTTRGTNALLERKGAPTLFVTTKGFGEVLEIGDQTRSDLFQLQIKKPEMLYLRVMEVDERIAADGSILCPIKEEPLQQAFYHLKQEGIVSVAICLMNAYCNPVHEIRIKEIAESCGFDDVVISSAVSPLIGIVKRGDTTMVDAYLTPVIRDYILRIKNKLHPDSDFKVMTSAGGLVSTEHFIGKDSILSGPAGGVVGCAQVAQEAGFQSAIGFDMGGTSTDVSRFDGVFEYSFETRKAGVRISAPTLAIETVAAGGGSICAFDGQKLVVGPMSAGASPGPACYGAGGPLTVTDCNLVLGRLIADRFPFQLDEKAAKQRLREVAKILEQDISVKKSIEELATGFIAIANENMERPIRNISIARGYDLREYVLICFGGAGGQHACAIARKLAIPTVIIHPYAGILSAYGMGQADVKKFAERQILKIYTSELKEELSKVFLELEAQTKAALLKEGIPQHQIKPPLAMLEMRYSGQDSTLTIHLPGNTDLSDLFIKEHRDRFGFVFEKREVEVVIARIEHIGCMERVHLPVMDTFAYSPEPNQWVPVYFEKGTRNIGLYLREELKAGATLKGPAIIQEKNSSVFLEPGWSATVSERMELLLKDEHQGDFKVIHSEKVDPIQLELFFNRFASIAEQMGEMLRKISISTNIKERLDFSCAVFTDRGELVANAPHIPVHLGAMGDTVRGILQDNPTILPGDVYVTNDPFRGGSHLPDITVITPVFDRDGKQLIFFAANRAHHQEIGGASPGSTPAFSYSLADEGVLIRNFKLVDRGIPRWKTLERLLMEAPYPTRSPKENLADLSAQVAANQSGAQLLRKLVESYSLSVVLNYMNHIQDAAEQAMRSALSKQKKGKFSFTDYMDDGTPIRLMLTIKGDSATLDFSGTGPVINGNLNANPAIVRAAVLYCFQCLIDRPIPLNEGGLAPLKINLPVCFLNPPAHPDPFKCAAVAGGNVETSQRIVDTIFGALGVVAASQGSMNNLSFGCKSFGYYETIGGGSGAGPGYAGTSAIHSHMTNTRLTDPEVLEERYPLRVRTSAIRQNSGGSGMFHGGDGMIREIQFLEPLYVSILSERRSKYKPYGLNGGFPGKTGRNLIFRADGTTKVLGGKVKLEVQPGDILRIETPGGGGWGKTTV
jgi:5-oxoprolinase (ATP-hydrolysing)